MKKKKKKKVKKIKKKKLKKRTVKRKALKKKRKRKAPSRKKNVSKEGEIFTFVEKDKVKLIKVLVKRLNGKLSVSENETLLAQVKFPINFQKQKI